MTERGQVVGRTEGGSGQVNESGNGVRGGADVADGRAR
jgi:hypothetical protein